MKVERPKNNVKKMLGHCVFWGCIAAIIIYLILNVKPPGKGDVIDKTITYTTTYTDTITLDLKPSQQEIVQSIDKYVAIPEGGMDWKLLSKTKSIPYSYEDDEGNEIKGVRPEFDPALKALDTQDITMQGYMFPLNAGDEQTSFLFGPFPVSCPYHYHVGPALVIEAHTNEAVKFGFEPITLTGRLELVPKDDEYNLFYRLKNARLTK